MYALCYVSNEFRVYFCFFAFSYYFETVRKVERPPYGGKSSGLQEDMMNVICYEYGSAGYGPDTATR